MRAMAVALMALLLAPLGLSAKHSTAHPRPLRALSMPHSPYGEGLISMVPDRARGKRFEWCHRAECLRDVERVSRTSRTWLFDASAAAWGAPFTPLGSGELWKGWTWSESPCLTLEHITLPCATRTSPYLLPIIILGGFRLPHSPFPTATHE